VFQAKHRALGEWTADPLMAMMILLAKC
jgi:hypothetical protein